VQDLWLALPGRGAETERQRALFLDAYRELRELDRSTLRLIEPLRALRMIRYAVWIARRWDDPAFKIGWPQFADPEFWRRETEDLEEQLAVIQNEASPAGERARRDLDRGSERGAGAGATADSAAELTNKDYFWDWEGK
jgi:Ser/Thr protein kinase RdoA (MazF antagonist)